MVQVTFNGTSAVYDAHAFYQYDFGRTIKIHGLELPNEVQIHFARKNLPAEIVIGTTADGITTARVPATTLQTEGEFTVYIYITTDTSGQTYKSITFYTRRREKPGDYAPPDEPNVVQQLMDKLDQIIETGIASYVPDQAAVNAMILSYVKNNMITNNDAATVAGTAWDAVRGKAIRDTVTSIQNSVVNNLTTALAGSILDARQGKVLKDIIDTLNNNLANLGSNYAGVTMSPEVNSVSYSTSIPLPKASAHAITITTLAITGLRYLDATEYTGKITISKYANSFRINTSNATLLAAIKSQMLDIEYTVS